MTFKSFTIERDQKPQQIMLEVGFYRQTGNISVAAHLIDADTGKPAEQLCPITAAAGQLSYGDAAIDVASQKGIDMVAFLEANGLGQATGQVVSGGSCEYPVFRFDLGKLEDDASFAGKELIERRREGVTVGLIEPGGFPRMLDIYPDEDGSYLHALQGLVGGYIEYFCPLYADAPALIINDDGKSTCPPNRAVYANERMVEKDCYLSMFSSGGQAGYGKLVEEGELYEILCGNIVALSHESVLLPSTGEYEDVERDISYEEFEQLWKDFADPLSAIREIKALRKAWDQEAGRVSEDA